MRRMTWLNALFTGGLIAYLAGATAGIAGSARRAAPESALSASR